MSATQHAGLTEERWRRYPRGQQVLMIANEMNRGRSSMAPTSGDSRRAGYERVLRLVDLTVAVNSGRGLRRELLRWRELVAELYLDGDPRPEAHDQLLRVLLSLEPLAYPQLALLFPPPARR